MSQLPMTHMLPAPQVLAEAAWSIGVLPWKLRINDSGIHVQRREEVLIAANIHDASESDWEGAVQILLARIDSGRADPDRRLCGACQRPVIEVKSAAKGTGLYLDVMASPDGAFEVVGRNREGLLIVARVPDHQRHPDRRYPSAHDLTCERRRTAHIA